MVRICLVPSSCEGPPKVGLKLAQLSLGGRPGKIPDHLDFSFSQANTRSIDMVGQEFKLGDTELALGDIDQNAVVFEAVQQVLKEKSWR